MLDGGLCVFVVGARGRVSVGCQACRRAFFGVRFPGPNLRQVQCPATVAGHTLRPLFWAGSRPPFGDRLSARGGQRADAGAAMLSAPGVGRCAGDLTHRGGCLARALGLQSSCVGVAVAVFERRAMLWAR